MPATARTAGSRCDGEGSGNGAEPEAKALLPGTQIADAGAARRPKGPEQGLREPDGVPREAQPAPSGPGGTGPRVADEAPAYPSHPGRTPGTDGACTIVCTDNI